MQERKAGIFHVKRRNEWILYGVGRQRAGSVRWDGRVVETNRQKAEATRLEARTKAGLE